MPTRTTRRRLTSIHVSKWGRLPGCAAGQCRNGTSCVLGNPRAAGVGVYEHADDTHAQHTLPHNALWKQCALLLILQIPYLLHRNPCPAVLIKNKAFTNGGRLRINMGNVYFEQKQYSSAIKMYRMALDQVPSTSKEVSDMGAAACGSKCAWEQLCVGAVVGSEGSIPSQP